MLDYSLSSLLDLQLADAAGRGRREVRARVPEMPVGWRAEDILGIAAPVEFFPVAEAARRMGLPVEEVEGLAVEGWLDARVRGGELFVVPVVLSTLHVEDPRVAVDDAAPKPEPNASPAPPRDAYTLAEFGRREP